MKERNEKSADRPHHFTLVIGLLSPLISVIAFWISLQSLKFTQESIRLNQLSMKVAQRAYLSIAGGHYEENGPYNYSNKTEIYSYSQNYPASPKPETPFWLLKQMKGGQAGITLNHTFTIRNQGNTPAMMLGLKRDFRLYGKYASSGMILAETSPSLSSNEKNEIAPKTELTVSVTDFLQMSNAQLGYIREGELEKIPMLMQGKLLYQDVFGDSHTAVWCWADTALSGNNTEECSPNDLKSFAPSHHQGQP